jgi:beta-glucosidase
VTENGAAFDDRLDEGNRVADTRRIHYLQEHIQALAGSLKSGVPLRGYFVWSFLDNFEWIDGYSKRFGIVYVDYPTQRRIVKDSGYWYADFIRSQRS